MRQRIRTVAHSPVSLVARILAVAALALVLLASTLLVVITQVVDRTVYAQSQATVTHADIVLRYLVAQKGAPALIDGKLTFGRWVANNDNTVVDQLEQLTGATATLFQALPHGRYIRVATTIRNVHGHRNIGTLVLGPAAAAVARGRTYTGINPILGRPYVTEYALIRDQRGRSIGLTYTGIPLTTLARAEGHMVAVVLAVTLGALVVGLGLLAVALRPIARAIAQLETRATTDPLTGLGNHRAYQETLHRETARAARDLLPLALALIDVDDFKTINDRYGHAQGDQTLAALGALLGALRAGDAAFRLGGDEFALLLPHTSRADARVVLERLCAQAPHLLGGATVSIGFAVAMPDEPPASAASALGADTLQERADAALYEAKRRGRDAVVPFTDIGEGAAVLPSAKVRAVRCLLAEGRVAVAFQPIWDLERGGILAYEALARPDPAYGLDGPQEAFDIAERIGRAHELDALCRAAILARAREVPPDTLLFLNVSPQSLDHDLLAGTALVEEVAAAGVAPARVVLEITERSLARLPVVAREAKRLRALGFKLALDDVGAGNAGLEMLRLVPVDVVKIDRVVVANALGDTTAQAVFAAILAFAGMTGSRVVAEGIETAAMLTLVRQAGRPGGRPTAAVWGVQGYLLGRPSGAPIAHAVGVPHALSA